MVTGCVAVFAASLWLQANRVQAQNDLSITASFNSQTPLTPDTLIELHLSRPLKTADGRVAVIINRSDVTSLFVSDGTRLVYSAALVPLPLGESELVAYLVGPDNIWRELGRSQLRVAPEKPPPPHRRLKFK